MQFSLEHGLKIFKQEADLMKSIESKPYFCTGRRLPQGPGEPNDGFLSDPLKRYLRLSGVPLKLCRFILGCAIIFLSVRLFYRGTFVFSKLLGHFCSFSENLMSYFLSENLS